MGEARGYPAIEMAPVAIKLTRRSAIPFMRRTVVPARQSEPENRHGGASQDRPPPTDRSGRLRPGTTATQTTAPTRELRGWYFYDWACSAFSTTVVTVFLGPYLTTITENAADP